MCDEAKAINLRGREGGAMPELDDLASLRAADGGSSRSYVLTSGSSAPSHRSEDSTSDLSERGCESSPKPKSIRGDDESSASGSPDAESTTTYEVSAVSENQRAEVLTTPYARQLTKGGGKPGQGYPLIFSQAGSRARTSALPGSDEGSPANGPACSSSLPGSQMSFDQSGFSLRTSLGSSPLPTAETLGSFSQRWPTSGMAWRGGFSTLVSSEFPSAAVECSLSDVLVENPSARYGLSARAATGILRRAAARGRALRPALEEALLRLSSSGTPKEPTATRRTA